MVAIAAQCAAILVCGLVMEFPANRIIDNQEFAGIQVSAPADPAFTGLAATGHCRMNTMAGLADNIPVNGVG